MIEIWKVVNDDRDWQGYDQHPADAAHTPHQLAPDCFRTNVTVANGRHGDGCPPKRFWNARKFFAIVVFLCKIGQAGKDEYADGKEGHEKTELFVTPVQCVAEGLESGGMSGQFEDPEDSHDPEELHDSAHVLYLFSPSSQFRFDQAQGDVIRQDCHQVYSVQNSFQELDLWIISEELISYCCYYFNNNTLR